MRKRRGDSNKAPARRRQQDDGDKAAETVRQRRWQGSGNNNGKEAAARQRGRGSRAATAKRQRRSDGDSNKAAAMARQRRRRGSGDSDSNEAAAPQGSVRWARILVLIPTYNSLKKDPRESIACEQFLPPLAWPGTRTPLVQRSAQEDTGFGGGVIRAPPKMVLARLHFFLRQLQENVVNVVKCFKML
jgi:hypothetical protein